MEGESTVDEATIEEQFAGFMDLWGKYILSEEWDEVITRGERLGFLLALGQLESIDNPQSVTLTEKGKQEVTVTLSLRYRVRDGQLVEPVPQYVKTSDTFID